MIVRSERGPRRSSEVKKAAYGAVRREMEGEMRG